MYYKSFLIKYAEIGVKGKNRYIFEEALVKQIERVLSKCDGEFAVTRVNGRMYVDAKNFDMNYVIWLDAFI